MSKIIEVNNCEECPYNHLKKCFHPDIFKEKKEYPKIEDVQTIPEFCPLTEGEDYAEGAFDIDRKF